MSSREKEAAERQRRKSVLLTGIIAFADGTRSFDCTVHDLSASGARIAAGKTMQLPSRFYLINIRDRVAYDCEAVWNRGSEAGIAFKKVLPLANITDPALGFLKRLWLSKATR